MDVAKAIDKAAGKNAVESAARLKAWRTESGLSRGELADLVGCTPASIRDWEEGRSRRKGDPPEFLVPSPKYQQRLNELCSYGTDARTIAQHSQSRVGDGTVIGLGHTGVIYGEATTDLAKQWEGFGTDLKPGYGPVIVCRKPLEGTVANNVLTHGTGAINIDACRIAVAGGVTTQGRFPANIIFSHHPDCRQVGAVDEWACDPGCPVAELDHQSGDRPGMKDQGHGADSTSATFGQAHSGRVASDGKRRKGFNDNGGASRFFTCTSPEPEAWACVPDCPVAELDHQSGTRTSGSGAVKRRSAADQEGNIGTAYGAESRPAGTEMISYGDSGGASRFFFCSKTSPAERKAGLDGEKNPHPTVKPIAVMEWLVKLVTPPGGVVLDPFCGSGSTLVAASNLGFDSIGIDRDDDGIYLDVAEKRIRHVGATLERVDTGLPET